MIRVGPMFIAWSESPGRGAKPIQGGGDVWMCDEHPGWLGDEMGTWAGWLAQTKKWGWSQQRAASWWASSPEVHARHHGLSLVCICCEEGYYCRHRCPVHPKLDGLEDSGKPWRTSDE